DLTTDQSGATNLRCLVSDFTAPEEVWLHGTVMPALNRAVADAVRDHGWRMSERVPETFAGHGYCAAEKWTTEFNTANIGPASFPVNHKGHEALAESLIAPLDAALGSPVLPGPPEPSNKAMTINAFRSLAANGPITRIADVNDASADGSRRVARTLAPNVTF